jgi:hypothetical protein
MNGLVEVVGSGSEVGSGLTIDTEAEAEVEVED